MAVQIQIHTMFSCFVLTVILAGLLPGHTIRGHQVTCSEPENLLELYRDLRQQQLLDSTASQGLSQSSTSTASATHTVTKLKKTPEQRRFPTTCGCATREGLNHDPNRIPRVMAQSSCRHHNDLRKNIFVGECENLTMSVKVKRRSGCVSGVYQYVDAWESIPVGCKCQVHRRMGSM